MSSSYIHLFHSCSVLFFLFFLPPGAVRFSPDNNVLALASGDSSIYLYNVRNFQPTLLGIISSIDRPLTNISVF